MRCLHITNESLKAYNISRGFLFKNNCSNNFLNLVVLTSTLSDSHCLITKYYAGDRHPRVGMVLACLADVYAWRGKAKGTGDIIITEVSRFSKRYYVALKMFYFIFRRCRMHGMDE